MPWPRSETEPSSWFGNIQPSNSAADIELWAAGKTTWSSRRSHSARSPLQASVKAGVSGRASGLRMKKIAAAIRPSASRPTIAKWSHVRAPSQPPPFFRASASASSACRAASWRRGGTSMNSSRSPSKARSAPATTVRPKTVAAGRKAAKRPTAVRRAARAISPCQVRAGFCSRVQTRRAISSISTWLANEDAAEARTTPTPARTSAHRRSPPAKASQTPAATGLSAGSWSERVRAVRARGGRKKRTRAVVARAAPPFRSARRRSRGRAMPRKRSSTPETMARRALRRNRWPSFTSATSAFAPRPLGCVRTLPRRLAGMRAASAGSWARALRTRTPRSGTERATRSAPSEKRAVWALCAARRKPARKGSELTTARAVPTSSGR